MSSLSTIIPNSTAGTTSVTNPNGFQSLTPADFIQMMVTQLQNQDPLDPTNSQDILTQMSEIGQLQSSDQLQTSLTSLTLQNQIGSASSLIGKSITGTDASNNPQNGTVTSVSITPSTTNASGTTAAAVNLNLSTGAVVPLANVTAITSPTTPTPTTSTTTTPTAGTTTGTTTVPTTPPVTTTVTPPTPLQTLLGALGGGGA